MENQAGSFVAYDEQERAHTIYKFQEYVDASSKTDPKAKVDTFLHLRNSRGGVLQRKEKGVYLDFDTGETLTSDDPNAP